MSRFLVVIFTWLVASEAVNASDVFEEDINISDKDILEMINKWGEIKDLGYLKNNKKIYSDIECVNNNPYYQFIVHIKPARNKYFNGFPSVLLKSPYKYDLLILGLKNDMQLSLYLVLADDINNIVQEDIVAKKSKVKFSNFRYMTRVQFETCSFRFKKNNKVQEFRLVIKDNDGNTLYTSEPFKILARRMDSALETH